jgi:hypothetical protein
MICSPMINASLLIGVVISWAIMWPLIEGKRGHWYRTNLSASDRHGIQGYRVLLLFLFSFLIIFLFKVHIIILLRIYNLPFYFSCSSC